MTTIETFTETRSARSASLRCRLAQSARLEAVLADRALPALRTLRQASSHHQPQCAVMNKWLSGEWVIDRTSARQRRTLHYWLTIIWFTAGTVVWISLRDSLWFVGFMSLYAIWISHLAGWAAETPVETEDRDT